MFVSGIQAASHISIAICVPHLCFSHCFFKSFEYDGGEVLFFSSVSSSVQQLVLGDCKRVCLGLKLIRFFYWGKWWAEVFNRFERQRMILFLSDMSFFWAILERSCIIWLRSIPVTFRLAFCKCRLKTVPSWVIRKNYSWQKNKFLCNFNIKTALPHDILRSVDRSSH